MTDEVEAPTTEADFAFEYARERKMRMALETRLFGLMHEVVPYLQVATRLVDGIMKEDHESVVQSLARLSAWRADVEIALRLNTVWVAGDTRFFSDKEIEKAAKKGTFPDDKNMRLQKHMQRCSKDCVAQWDELAAQYGLLTAKEASQRDMKEFEGLMLQKKREFSGKD